MNNHLLTLFLFSHLKACVFWVKFIILDSEEKYLLTFSQMEIMDPINAHFLNALLHLMGKHIDVFMSILIFWYIYNRY